MEGTDRAVKDNESQMQLCIRKKRKLEGDLAETQDNCDIVQKYTEMLTKDKEFLQQKLEEKEKEIRSLQSKQLEYENKICDLKVKLATVGAEAKQRLKYKLKHMKQEKEELVKCIEAKQKEVNKVANKMSKLKLKLERAKTELSVAQSQLKLKTSQLHKFKQQLKLVQDQRNELKKQLGMHEKAMEEAVLQHLDSDKVATKPPDLPIEEEEWFFGDIDRKLAELKCVTNGEYLVRYSAHKNKYVLTCNWNGMGRHFVIQQITDEMGQAKFCFELKAFPSIRELLGHYKRCGIPITRRSGVILEKSISRFDEWSVRYDDFLRGRKIGRGSFGDVFEGVLLTTQEKVVVKTCQMDVVPMEDIRKFLKKAEVLKQYKHPNIVRLIGVCVEKAIYILMELMPGGTFLDFLCKKGPHQPKTLSQMCVDVCSGMACLEANNCIHYNLSALNCLVGESGVIKISNIGGSQLEEEDIYIVSSRTSCIPIKWTAPEALNYGIFTSSSDVWSFGVLLWEVFSCGSIPYPGMSNQDTRKQIERGYRMPPPTDTPEEIYGIMLQCWQYDPEERPDFVTLLSMLQKAIEKIIH